MSFWIFPLASIAYCPAAIIHDGSHTSSGPVTVAPAIVSGDALANSGADPTSPITADFTTMIGWGPVLNSKVSTP